MTAYYWEKPLWYCPDCATGYEGDSNMDEDVRIDMQRHNRDNHDDADAARKVAATEASGYEFYA